MVTPRMFLLLLAVTAALVAAPAGTAAAGRLSSSDAALLKEINKTRASFGLRALAYDTSLARAAAAHTRSMTARGVFEHGSFRTRMLRFRVGGPHVGENLAWGVGERATPRGIVEAWLASPGHRENLLRPGFRRIGLGQVQASFGGADGATVVTADFAGI
jgi:uncharacterized protein YkwD